MAFEYSRKITEVSKLGQFLGQGTSKQSYLVGDKVYKFAILDDAYYSDQITFEKETYEKIPRQLKDILPETEFVTVTETHGDDTETYVYSISERIQAPKREAVLSLTEEWGRDYTIYDFIKTIYLFGAESLDLYRYYTELVDSFLHWLGRVGGVTEDIIYNSDNYGLNDKGELKILDWGA